MPDFRKTIDGIILDGVITTSQDGEGSNCYTITLQTLAAEGETPVKKYRLNLPSFNPSNQKVFANTDEVISYAMSLQDYYFGPWFNDVEEAE